MSPKPRGRDPKGKSGLFTCGLARTFKNTGRTIPYGKDKNIVFSRAMLPSVEKQLQTGRIIITKGQHGYGFDFRQDLLHFQADKETLRNLGLLILSVVFRSIPSVRIQLTNPKSEVKNLIVSSSRDAYVIAGLGYQVRPNRFDYWPSTAARHPWHGHADLSPRDLPFFGLSTMRRDRVVGDALTQTRDTVYGFGRDNASVLFAKLLVDASNPDSRINQFDLESEAGFRGVAPASAEAYFHLPGSMGWTGDLPG